MIDAILLTTEWTVQELIAILWATTFTGGLMSFGLLLDLIED